MKTNEVKLVSTGTSPLLKSKGTHVNAAKTFILLQMCQVFVKWLTFINSKVGLSRFSGPQLFTVLITFSTPWLWEVLRYSCNRFFSQDHCQQWRRKLLEWAVSSKWFGHIARGISWRSALLEFWLRFWKKWEKGYVQRTRDNILLRFGYLLSVVLFAWQAKNFASLSFEMRCPSIHIGTMAIDTFGVCPIQIACLIYQVTFQG